MHLETFDDFQITLVLPFGETFHSNANSFHMFTCSQKVICEHRGHIHNDAREPYLKNLHFMGITTYLKLKHYLFKRCAHYGHPYQYENQGRCNVMIFAQFFFHLF